MTETSDVDSLVEAVQGSIKVSLEDDDPALIHPRYCLYKKRPTSEECQEERRRNWLKEQKDRRFELKYLLRGIIDESEDDDDVDKVEDMQLDPGPRTRKKIARRRKPKDILMHSTWLVDVPNDLKTDWYFTVVPEGRRCLVISHRGETVAYSRRGQFMMRFPSALPGGHYRSMRSHSSPPTMLDCIWSCDVKTLFVVDIMTWSDIDLSSCDAAFRFFWLVCKRDEAPELACTSEINRYKFEFLEHKFAADVEKSLDHHPIYPNNNPKIDGLLFFHKRSFYIPGRSPIVTWLKPFMVPDILNLPVHESYLSEIPSNYADAMEVDGGRKDSFPSPLIPR